MINALLDTYDKIKEIDHFLDNKCPLNFELEEIKITVSDYVESASGKVQGLKSGWLSKTRRTIHLYNIYGRIITKKNKGCSH